MATARGALFYRMYYSCSQNGSIPIVTILKCYWVSLLNTMFRYINGDSGGDGVAREAL